MLTGSSTIKLELESKPQSVAIARGMLSAVLELLGFEAELLDDVKMAVSEACNNVVLHAYGAATGPLFVDFELTGKHVGVTVRDEGVGISELAPAEGRLGVGIPMMQTLAEDASFRVADGGGTEVRLTFRWDSAVKAPPDPAATEPRNDGARPRLSGEVVVTGCPPPLLAAVLGRLATIVAAEARFSVDRLSDVRLLTDAVAARVQAVTDLPTGFALAKTLRRLELTIGPLDAGVGDKLLPDDESLSTGSFPLKLADGWRAQTLDGYDVVKAAITESSPATSAGRSAG